jgi:hypothetical protein
MKNGETIKCTGVLKQFFDPDNIITKYIASYSSKTESAKVRIWKTKLNLSKKDKKENLSWY